VLMKMPIALERAALDSPTTARLRHIGTSTVRTPHLAGALCAAATVALTPPSARLRIVRGGVLGALGWAASSTSARLDREIRSAQDAAVLSTRLGRNAPLLGGWAVEADFAGIVSREIETGPNLVVECGSGTSTLVIADQLERNGHGQLISLEHEVDFAAATMRRLVALGVQHRVSVVHAPLGPVVIDGRPVHWYDRRMVESSLRGQIDVLVVDGPPERPPSARWPAVEVFYPYLASDARVYLDDGRTPHVLRTLRAWRSAHPDLELYWIDTVKGTWLLRRSSRTRTRRFRFGLGAQTMINPRPVGSGRWPVRR
jgi:predicted O-methyltransferase YrrM